MLEQFAEYLKRFEIFKDLTDEEALSIVSQCKKATYVKDQKLFSEGDPSDRLIMVSEGSLRVESNNNTLSVVNQYEIVGEMGVFTGQKRSADVFADSDCHTLELSTTDVEKIIDGNQALGLKLYRNVVSVLSRHLKGKNFILEMSTMLDAFDNDSTD